MFSNPSKNLKMLHIQETDIVADLGAGSGFYTIEAAHMAHRGKVYAIEISKDYAKTVVNKVKDAKLSNVEVMWGDAEKKGGTKLADSIVDKAIVSNVFSQIGEKNLFLEECKRILKKGGKVLFVDWDETSPIPHKGILLSKDKIVEHFTKHGFTVERDVDAGEHHYGMIFVRN